MRLPLHLQATTAETTTTIAASRRASYVDGAAGVSGTSCSGNNSNNNNNGSISGGSALSENGGSTRRHQRRDNYRQRLPYTARFQKLDSEPDSSWPPLEEEKRVRVNTWLWAARRTLHRRGDSLGATVVLSSRQARESSVFLRQGRPILWEESHWTR